MNCFSIAKSLIKEEDEYINCLTADLTEIEKISYLDSDVFKETIEKFREIQNKKLIRTMDREIQIREMYKSRIELKGYKNTDKIFTDEKIDKPDSEKKAPKHHYIFDISPPPNTTPEKLLSFTNEVINEIDIKEIELAVEQRGHNDETKFNGIHTHANIITNSTETLDKLKSKCKDIFKKYDFNPAILTFKCFGSLQHFKNRKEYIRGNKVGLDKDGIDKSIKIPFDKELRRNLKIPDLITNETINCLKHFNWSQDGEAGTNGGDIPSPIISPPIVTPSNVTINFI